MEDFSTKRNYSGVRDYTIDSYGIVIKTNHFISEDKIEEINLTNINDFEEYKKDFEKDPIFVRRRKEVFNKFDKLEREYTTVIQKFDEALINLRDAIYNKLNVSKAVGEYNIQLRNYQRVVEEIVGDK